MSTILITSNFSSKSAAQHVVSRYISENKIDRLFFSGTVKSSKESKIYLNKFLRYLFLIGPLINPRLLLDLISNLKSNDVVILDSSHYNILIPFIRILFPSVLIKIIYHNNELIFLKSEFKFYRKNYQIVALFGALIKFPYTLMIRQIEKFFKCTIIYISTLDIKYNRKNEIEFFDLTKKVKTYLPNVQCEISNFTFVGNDFYNNHIQISEFLVQFPGYIISTYGSVDFKGSPFVISKGPYNSTADLPAGSSFFLGSNATGFPIKSLEYLSVDNSRIFAYSTLSLNLMINPRVFISKKR